MFNLFEHLQNGKELWLGDYKTLPACERATEIRWDIMKQLGYSRAMFHCENAETGSHSVGWVYKDGGDEDVVGR